MAPATPGVSRASQNGGLEWINTWNKCGWLETWNISPLVPAATGNMLRNGRWTHVILEASCASQGKTSGPSSGQGPGPENRNTGRLENVFFNHQSNLYHIEEFFFRNCSIDLAIKTWHPRKTISFYYQLRRRRKIVLRPYQSKPDIREKLFLSIID